MTREQYEALAALTLSSTFELDGFTEDPLPGAPKTGELFEAMLDVVHAARHLERLKKAIYYGKEYNRTRMALAPEKEVRLGILGSPTINMLHAVMGIATEAGELMEATWLSMFQGKGLDRANLVEELGDGEWYAALLRGELGVSQENVQKGNIAKLKARYPDKEWDRAAALNRDPDEEMKALAAAAHKERWG